MPARGERRYGRPIQGPPACPRCHSILVRRVLSAVGAQPDAPNQREQPRDPALPAPEWYCTTCNNEWVSASGPP